MRYRTIVADPPWPYPEGWVQNRGQYIGSRKPLPYPSMSLEEIKALPISAMADPSGCHVYLWTTNRYLRAAFDILDSWFVRYGQMLVWAKTPSGIGPGGTFAQSSEYVLFGRIGVLRSLQRLDSTWFGWPRQHGHSRKPEAFIDMVETVSPGPYLELFARRQRLGWDTWGNECFNHVEMPA